MGLGYRKQPVKAAISDVTASRAIDGTIYQNTTGRPKFVIVTIRCCRVVGAGNFAYVDAWIGAATPPTTQQSIVGLSAEDTPEETTYDNLIFAVPNEYYYKVTPHIHGASVTVKSKWIEVEL